jgi:hypothetical protein
MTTRIPRRKKLAGDERAAFSAEVAELYAGGASIAGIAAETGRSYGAIHRLLREHPDVQIRPTGSAPRADAAPACAEQASTRGQQRDETS